MSFVGFILIIIGIFKSDKRFYKAGAAFIIFEIAILLFETFAMALFGKAGWL